MMALGISPGDEVIVPPITDIGSIVPVLWQGCRAGFCGSGSAYLQPLAGFCRRMYHGSHPRRAYGASGRKRV